MTAGQKTLLIGYGNPGRLDDGLGPALAAALGALGLPDLTVESDYQLSLEHAELAAGHDVVIFADASAAGPAPYFFEAIKPAGPLAFSSHALGPQEVLAICRSLFGGCPAGFVLGIRGYQFEGFGEELSAGARANLAAAAEFLRNLLVTDDWSPRHAQVSLTNGSTCACEELPCSKLSL